MKTNITESQARAIYCLHNYNGGYVLPELKDLDWFIARVKPQIANLKRLGYLKDNGFGELSLTPTALDAYAEWYSQSGWRKDRQIQNWA